MDEDVYSYTIFERISLFPQVIRECYSLITSLIRSMNIMLLAISARGPTNSEKDFAMPRRAKTKDIIEQSLASISISTLKLMEFCLLFVETVLVLLTVDTVSRVFRSLASRTYYYTSQRKIKRNILNKI